MVQWQKSFEFRIVQTAFVPGQDEEKSGEERITIIKEDAMNNIPLRIEDTSLEVYARIARAEAAKYNCSMNIDYSGNRREISLTGDNACAHHILEDVKNILTPLRPAS